MCYCFLRGSWIKNYELEGSARDMIQEFLRTKVKQMATKSQKRATRVIMIRVNQPEEIKEDEFLSLFV